MQYAVWVDGVLTVYSNYGSAFAAIRKLVGLQFDVVVFVDSSDGAHVLQAFGYSPAGVTNSDDLKLHTVAKVYNFLVRKHEKEYAAS